MSKERNHYRKSCKECKDNVRNMYTIDTKYVPPPATVSHPAMSQDTTIHYSFDMAQQVSFKYFLLILSCVHHFHLLQVHYPCDPLQPGPMYFLTPRKCAIFGVSCEGLPRQVIIFVRQWSLCERTPWDITF